MKSIFVASSSPYAGKNLVCLGLAKKFQKDGMRVGYFKPIGTYPVVIEGVLTDEDVLFYKKALELKDSLEDISPVILTQNLIDEAFNGKPSRFDGKIKQAYNKICKDKDVVLVMGMGNLSSGSFLGFSEKELIEKLNSKVIFVDSLKENVNDTCDSFLQAKQILKDRLVGVIFNRVAPKKVEYLEKKVIPFLKKKKIDVLGNIIEDPVLGAVTVKELKEALNGKILCCMEKQDDMVEHFMIGAMNADAALRFFKRVTNKAVITGGDRSDIQLAALSTSTKCLILTGDMYPEDMIVSKAQEQGVPIMVVPSDTLTTVDRFESLLGHLSLRNESKIPKAAEAVEKSIDFSAIRKSVGLKKEK